MNRTAFLLVVLLAVTVLTVPTGASQRSGVDQVTENVEMAPAEGPNGAYAVLNENGEIAILLSEENPFTEARGINVNTVAVFDNVFTVTNTGDERVTVWLTDEVEDVRFFGGVDSATSVEGRENGVTLHPGERVQVGLRVDTRGDHSDVENMSEFTVHTRLPDRQGTTSDTSDTEVSDGPSVTSNTDPTPTATPASTSTTTPTPTATPAPPATQTPASTPETGTPSTDRTEQTIQTLGGFGLPVPLSVLVPTVLIVVALTLWHRGGGPE